MSEPRPVLVVHGVANRDRGAFAEQVEQLHAAVGLDRPFLPVFWGDLGAAVEGIEATLPQVPLLPGRTRSDTGAAPPPLVRDLLAGRSGAALTRAGTGWEVVADAATGQRAASSGAATRATVRAPAQAQAREVRDAVREEWPRTRTLQTIRDEELLAEIGRALAEGLDEEGEAAPSPVRGAAGAVGRRVRGVLKAIDRAVGAAIGTAAGNLNELLREKLGPGLGRFLGDVFVYESRRSEIQARLREALREHPGWGTEERPVDVIAHSLGGVVSFHAATEGEPPLWIDRLLTFGSQSAFFHVLRPLGGLAAYGPERPAALPRSIGSWVNLWEPLDPLAFLAGNVFRLHDGGSPRDVSVPHQASWGLWTHSAYWTADTLAEEIRGGLSR